MTKTFDCLFLHPSHHNGTPGYMVMPLGIVSLASELAENGFETRIIHVGLEKILNHNFQIKDFLKTNIVKIIAIDLHWTRHAYAAIRLAEDCKRIQQDTYVVLGGFTASFFDMEILQNFQFVDAIIRGEAETSLLELVNNVTRKRNRSSIPNVTLRNGSNLKRNPIGYLDDTEIFSNRNFTDLSLIEHGNEYLKIVKPLPFAQAWIYKKILPKLKDYDLNWLNYLRRGYVAASRGCSFNCSNCGGGRDAHYIISGRKEPILRSADRVVEDIIQWNEYGVRQLHIEPDPCPGYKSWYSTLFKKIREEGVDIAADYYPRALPDKEFVYEFARTFDPYLSKLVISPESGSERVRRINNFHHFYSNKELFKILALLEAQGVMAELYFSVGNSGETLDDFYTTSRMAEAILNEHRNIVGLCCHPVDVEPCAPCYLKPEKYGVKLYRKTFMEFLDFERRKSLGEFVEHPLGYRTKHMSEADMAFLSRNFANMVRRINVISGLGVDHST